ncbi:MAG: DUF3806 domain-containing protein [Planctomycetota bacterium]
MKINLSHTVHFFLVFMTVLCHGCDKDMSGKDKQNVPSDSSEITISDLSSSDITRLAEMRAKVESYWPDNIPKERYGEPIGKLALLDRMFQEAQVDRENTYLLHSMGVVLGDVIAEEFGLEWVAYQDQYGHEIALQVPGKSITLFPKTMISKRIEDGEDVRVAGLYEGLKEQLQQVIEDPEVKSSTSSP